MKKLFAVIISCGAALLLSALEISVLDFNSPDWKKQFSVTGSGFDFRLREENKALELRAVLDKTSPVIARREWHGWNLVPASELPCGKLTFEFKPGNMTTLWLNADGVDDEGKPRRLDIPVNLYGSNLAKPGEWNKVTFDLRKSHIAGQAPGMAGALATVRRIEIRLHPSRYTTPGTYLAEIRNITYETAE